MFSIVNGLLATFHLCVECDLGLCSRRESDKSTHSDTASQERKGAGVCARGREWSCTIQGICVSGSSL